MQVRYYLGPIVQVAYPDGVLINWRGQWTTGTSYAVDDAADFQPSGDIYRCLQSHTSAADNEPGSGAFWTDYWSEFSKRQTMPRTIYLFRQTLTPRGDWAIGIDYVVGDVLNAPVGGDYVCIQAHRSRSNNEPGAGVQWTNFWDVGPRTPSLMVPSVKNWSISEVRGPVFLHTAIQTDPEITLIPFFDPGGEYLATTAQVSELSAQSRTNIQDFLEARRIPTDWIQGTHTLGAVLKYIARIFAVMGWLKENYPELDLSTPASEIPQAKRQAVLDWMDGRGIETSDITLSWTVRQVLRRIIVQYPWRATDGQLGTGAATALL